MCMFFICQMTVLTQDNQLVLNSSSHFSLIIMPLLLSEIVLLETDCNHKFNMAVVMVEYVINKLQDDDNKVNQMLNNFVFV